MSRSLLLAIVIFAAALLGTGSAVLWWVTQRETPAAPLVSAGAALAWLTFVAGPLWGLLYFALFRRAVRRPGLAAHKHDFEHAGTYVSANPLVTPGHTEAATQHADSGVANVETSADRFITALGGPGNIRGIDAVALTRLRVVVVDDGRVDLDALRAAGAHGAMLADHGIVHVLVGRGAEAYLTPLRNRTRRASH